MQTNLADFVKKNPNSPEAEAIIRSCVHCGFCLATCPTYQLLGDELDSPRGRIYLMKQVLEGQAVTQKTQLHLDRCLTCRACETTCPSGVRYSHLLDITRGIVEEKVGRTRDSSIKRFVIRKFLTSKTLFKLSVRISQLMRFLLPAKLKAAIPKLHPEISEWPATDHSRKMLVLDGCVQPTLAPNINTATARVLDKLGISLMKAKEAGCCGALAYHLNAQQEGLDAMRHNIDIWWPFIETHQIEAIVISASGCGVTVKEYGHFLQHDTVYAEKAKHIASLAKDISEIIAAEITRLAALLNHSPIDHPSKLAFHSPCTLQHGMKIRGVVEKILNSTGITLCQVDNAHLCCGSAGTYSILQPELSQQLLKDKVQALTTNTPDQIVTANIGCLMHIQSGTNLPVKHWIEFLDELIDAQASTHSTTHPKYPT